MHLVIVANDAVVFNALRLLNSLSVFAPDLKVSYIPFNDDTVLCQRLFPLFGVEKVETDLEAVRAFQSVVYDDNPPQQPWPLMAGKLRKLGIADLPRPLMYIDTDCIITSPFDKVLATTTEMPTPLVFCSVSRGWVYEAAADRGLLAKSREFSSGFLMLDEGFPSRTEIMELVTGNLDEFRLVTKKDVVDQPLFNYVCDKLDIKTRSISEFCGYSTASTVGAKFEVGADWSVSFKGQPVLFLHGAGSYRKDPRFSYLFEAHLIGAIRTLKARLPEAEFAALIRRKW